VQTYVHVICLSSAVICIVHVVCFIVLACVCIIYVFCWYVQKQKVVACTNKDNILGDILSHFFKHESFWYNAVKCGAEAQCSHDEIELTNTRHLDLQYCANT